MGSKIPKPLITLEMANNHMGDVEHGERIIRVFGELAQEYPEISFAFKLQYRNLDTFIHKSVAHREDIKHVKRFNETRLSREEFDRLIATMRDCGFITMVTPFDEASVDTIEEQGIEIIKVASCSFNDWPLLERIVKTNKPIIASTAGASADAIDSVISFLTHRGKDFAILHCVAEYPAPAESMQLNQIDYFKARYPGLRVGFSTHESPGDTEIAKLAIAKGADIFEKHVGVPTETYALNAYSASPDQIRSWLQAITSAQSICGFSGGRSPVNQLEQESLLSLRRGAFAKHVITAGSNINENDIYFAFPPEADQITANEWGKYISVSALQDLQPDEPLLRPSLAIKDSRSAVLEIANRVKGLLAESQITVPGGADLEISHHYGIDRFFEVGLTMLTVVNRGYCKKLLICLPGQKHPEQFHKQKEEAFHILYGTLELSLNGNASIYQAGDVVIIEPGTTHSFFSRQGAVIEEISSTHFANDSFYIDEAINQNKDRKTFITYWMNQ